MCSKEFALFLQIFQFTYTYELGLLRHVLKTDFESSIVHEVNRILCLQDRVQQLACSSLSKRI